MTAARDVAKFVRMSTEEADALAATAERLGMSEAELMRQALRAACGLPTFEAPSNGKPAKRAGGKKRRR